MQPVDARPDDLLAEQFERHRPVLRAVAYRMLGSRTEAEDAVQEAWLRLARGAPDAVADLRGWLITVVGRLCLDALRARRARREQYVGDWLPEPFVAAEPGEDPAYQAEVVDSVGIALLVLLEALAPAERLAFVLHDVFAVPFEEIAEILDRTPAATRQLASRARRRVQDAPQPDADLAEQRRVVDAFLAAARAGDFEALLEVLDPDIVLRVDLGGVLAARGLGAVGAADIARNAQANARRFLRSVRPVVVNGAAGLLAGVDGGPRAVVSFTVVGGRIAAIDVIADPSKLHGPDDG